MSSTKTRPKTKEKASKGKKRRSMARGKEYYSGFAENVHENYIPRFLHIDELTSGTREEPKARAE